MNLRRLARIGSTAPKLAALALVLLAPSVASAQRGGHGGGGGHVTGGTNTSMGGHPGGYANPYGHHGHPYWSYGEPAIWGGGWGYGAWGWGNGYGGVGSMGMSPTDQEMYKQAEYETMMTRVQLNQMQAEQAYQQANLARQQALRLSSARGFEAQPVEVPAGLTGLVDLNRVFWPAAVNSDDPGLKSKSQEASSLLIKIHKQLLDDAATEGKLATDAKAKLDDLGNSARRSRQMYGGKGELLVFIGELKDALDRAPRRP